MKFINKTALRYPYSAEKIPYRVVTVISVGGPYPYSCSESLGKVHVMYSDRNGKVEYSTTKMLVADTPENRALMRKAYDMEREAKRLKSKSNFLYRSAKRYKPN